MKILVRSNFAITREVEELSIAIEKSCYLDQKKAKTLSTRLEHLLKKIDSLIQTADCFSKDLLTEQKIKALALVGRCQTLEIDSKIKNIAEEAEKLFINPNQKSKAKALRNAIYKLTSKNRLSTENRKLIRFAELMLEKTNLNQINTVEELLSGVDHDLALSLIELAQYLFFYHLNNALELFNTIPTHTIDELNQWTKTHQLPPLCFKAIQSFTPSEAKKTAQVLIGFTDHMTLFKSDKKLPSLQELEELFAPLS